MLRTTEALNKEGISTIELRRMVDRGELIRVRRGVYADLPLSGDHKQEHLRLARARRLM